MRKIKRWLEKLPLVAQIVFVTLFFLSIGVGLFFLIKHFNYRMSLPDAKLTEIVQASVAALGVLTIGSVAVVQYHKHQIEQQKHQMDQATHFSDRLSKAVAHLAIDEVTIRYGAVYEFDMLANDFIRDHNCVSYIGGILISFVKEGLEKLSSQGEKNQTMIPPSRDLLMALFVLNQPKYDSITKDLIGLTANYLNLSGQPFRNVKFCFASFEKARFYRAYLEGADLRYAKKLTAEQLLEAYIDDTTLLDPDLRAEYERLKAEQ